MEKREIPHASMLTPSWGPKNQESPSIPGYEIERLLGSGGMGKVFLAKQCQLKRSVAVKVIKLDGEDVGEKVQRFQREAELMAAVAHPNIVTVFDSLVANEHCYLIMEYIEGGTLRKWFEGNAPVALDRTLRVLRVLGDTLAVLHEQGIVHRDLKPENVLLRNGEEPMLTDFGIAVLKPDLGKLTHANQRLGTDLYAAPEQRYSLPMDERADQYSLAVLLYEMVTGKLPGGIVKPPSELNPKLNSELDRVVMRALHEDPEERFDNIREFVESVESILTTTDPEPFSPAPSWFRFGWIWVTLLVGCLGIVLFAFLFRIGGNDIGSNTPDGKSPQEEFTNSLGMTLVEIPPGKFMMGSKGDNLAARDEMPAHWVEIKRPFYMSVYETTIGQYREFVAAEGYKTTAETTGGGRYWDSKKNGFGQDPKFNWRLPLPRSMKFHDNLPVMQLSMHDAKAFCRWLSKNEKRNYRLPTEAEWEYACRAGTKTRWHSGDEVKLLDAVAWHSGNSSGIPHTVGTKRPNDFGLYDMHGNAREWCQDRYAPYAQDGQAGNHKKILYVRRGGSFGRPAKDLRSAARHPHDPGKSWSNNGFRVVLVLP